VPGGGSDLTGADWMAARKAERLIVLVSGAPAAGKTTLATGLADVLALPLISKDDIKESLVDSLGGPTADLGWSRQVGGAAMDLLWRLARRCPSAVLEANFRPHNPAEHAQLRALRATVVEVHCNCPPDELARRFAARARTAHPAHPLTELPAELIAEYDRPMAVGAVITVDTTNPVDIGEIARRVVEAARRARRG
jgi:predicted kinase